MWSKCIITLWVAVSIYHVNNNTWIIFIVLIGVLDMVACIRACMLGSWVSRRVCLSAWFSAIRMVLHVFVEQKCRTEMKREYHQTPCSMLQTPHTYTHESKFVQKVFHFTPSLFFTWRMAFVSAFFRYSHFSCTSPPPRSFSISPPRSFSTSPPFSFSTSQLRTFYVHHFRFGMRCMWNNRTSIKLVSTLCHLA